MEEEGGRPQHGKASRECLLQGLSEWLSEEMPESVNVSANLEICKVFYIEIPLFCAGLLALNTLHTTLPKLEWPVIINFNYVQPSCSS